MLRISTVSRHHPLHSRRRQLKLPLGSQRLLAVFEGVEGGFAIGASIITALAIAGLDRRLLLITALVSLVVSGFNSASVKYSSEHYLDELDGREKRSAFKHYFIPALLEFICYVGLSMLSVLPLFIIQDINVAVGVTIGITLLLLFMAGLWRGYILRTNGVRDGFEMLLLGGGIVIVGVVSGLFVHSL